MSVTLGDAVMYLQADDRDLKGGLKKADSRIKRFAKRSQKVLKTALKVGLLGAAAGIAAGAAIAIKSVMLAADAEEMLSKLAATFGKATSALQADLDKFAKATGRSRFELQGMAADMGSVFKAMGFTEEGAAALAKQTTLLAVDLGSFNNLPSEDVANRLTRAYTGEFESMKALGVVINQMTIDQELENQGIKTKWQLMDQVSRAGIINNIIMRQTIDAQGDAEKTSGSFTNQMIRLKATVKDTATMIGLKLLPVITPLVKKFGDFAEEVLPKVVFWIEHNLIPAFSWLLTLIQHQILPGFKKIADFMSKVLGPVFDALGRGAKFLGGTFLSGLVPSLETVADVVGKRVGPAFDGWMVALGIIPGRIAMTDEALADLLPMLGDTEAAIRSLDAAKVDAPFVFEDLTFLERFLLAIQNIGQLIGEVDWGRMIANELEQLQGAAAAVIDFFFGDFEPMIINVGQWFNDLLEPIGGIAGAVSSLIGLFKGLLDVIREAKLPWWLVKKSPTPLESGLRGISDALEKELNPQLGKFALQLQAAGGGVGSTTDARDFSRTTRVDQLTVNNGRDEQGVMQVLRNLSRA